MKKIMVHDVAAKKRAKKALKEAEKAVRKARKAVRPLSKKFRNQAEALQHETDKLAKKRAASLQSASKNGSKERRPADAYTPPLPTVKS